MTVYNLVLTCNPFLPLPFKLLDCVHISAVIEEELNQEQKLVDRAQRDPKAFGELYDRYYPKIYHYVLGRTGDVELTMDITSTTFFKALTEIKRFRWQGVSFCAWLYRIATNEVYAHYRKQKNSVALIENIMALPGDVDPLDEVIEAEEELQRHRDFLKLREKLARLPEKYQDVITLRFFENKEISEIAEILGKPEGTVKSLLHRGIARLKTQMAI